MPQARNVVQLIPSKWVVQHCAGRYDYRYAGLHLILGTFPVTVIRAYQPRTSGTSIDTGSSFVVICKEDLVLQKLTVLPLC
jgi:hypothetical protein